MKKTASFILLLILAILVFIPQTSLAHPGARDELGGHFRRADCTYLLHSPTALAQSAKNINELIALIKQNNSNNACGGNLSPATIDLEGFTFAAQPAPAPKQVETPKPAPAPKPAPKPAPAALQTGQSYPATLQKCVDGDTAHFNVNGKTYKTRFLYIDTPESTNQIEPYGKEASEFTCRFLKQGKITLETDGPTLYDKYDRLLAWVKVDGKLHQEEISMAGLVEDFYDYGDYKYEAQVNAALATAKANYAGMYASLKPKEEKPPTETKKEEVKSKPESKKPEEKKEKQEDRNKTTSPSSPSEKKIDKPAAQEKQETKKEVTEPEPIGKGYWITGFIIAFLLFLTPTIKAKLGSRPLLAHRMKSKKRMLINLFLLVIYVLFWWIILLVLLVELIHFALTRKK